MLLNEKKNHYLRAGLVLTGLMAALALLGCVWTPYPPTAMSGSEKFAAPCLRHLFGTDNFGRDIFSTTSFWRWVSPLCPAMPGSSAASLPGTGR